MKFRSVMASLTLGTLLLGQTAFATSPHARLSDSIANFKEAVYVNGQEQKDAFKQLIQDIRSQNITKKELLTFVKANSTADEYSSFEMAIEVGASEIQNLEELSASDLEVIGSQVLNMTAATGSSYRACEGEIFLGSLLLIGAVILAIEAIEDHTRYVDSTHGFYSRPDYRARDEAIINGTFAAFGAAAGLGLMSSCN